MQDTERHIEPVQGERELRYNPNFDGRSVTFWIIAANIVVYVLDSFLKTFLGTTPLEVAAADPAGGPIEPFQLYPLESWGYFSFDTAVKHLEVWRFLSFQFLHSRQLLWHIIFNMYALYLFGPIVESYLGPKRFLSYYLLCGVAGPMMYVVLMLLGVGDFSQVIPLVGASAGIFGILIACAMIAPDVRVLLLIPPIPMKLKTLVWVLIGIGVYSVLSSSLKLPGGSVAGWNAGGEAAHLGGAAAGAFLIRNKWLLGDRRDFKWIQMDIWEK